jgi:hypothetical protein
MVSGTPPKNEKLEILASRFLVTNTTFPMETFLDSYYEINLGGKSPIIDRIQAAHLGPRNLAEHSSAPTTAGHVRKRG